MGPNQCEEEEMTTADEREEKEKMWNFLTSEYFEDVVESSIKCTNPNTDDMMDLKAPSNAIKLKDLLTLSLKCTLFEAQCSDAVEA